MPDFEFELRGVSQTYDGITILNDINLRLQMGEVCGLVGASGSGKSTLLYIASKLVTPFQGEVFVNGVALKTEAEILNARKNHFGFIYQFHNLILIYSPKEKAIVTR